jgi:hypothetical protein
LALGLSAFVASTGEVLVGSREAVLATPVGKACAAGRVEPLPASAARLARLVQERLGLAATVVFGVCSPVANEGRVLEHSSSRRLPQVRAEEVAARLGAAGCCVRVVVVTDGPGRDGMLVVFAGAPR